jgi:hypothetical protein
MSADLATQGAGISGSPEVQDWSGQIVEFPHLSKTKHKNIEWQSGMVVHTCNLSSRETEARGS